MSEVPITLLDLPEDQDNDNEEEKAKDTIESELEREKSERARERVLWMIAVIVLFDSILLKDSQNSGYPIVILILELLGIVIYSSSAGVKVVNDLVDKLILMNTKRK